MDGTVNTGLAIDGDHEFAASSKQRVIREMLEKIGVGNVQVEAALTHAQNPFSSLKKCHTPGDNQRRCRGYSIGPLGWDGRRAAVTQQFRRTSRASSRR